ncbi:uncharacterized protein LTR77_009316 [Saxophila tyrrhenica]|uniref:Uncharacterized protein n=1 Tax=Saxophila tyrrhenica TaxID=1690608 RepID=A0AAV9P2M5_9PEZI|nr:hypothetical protein LTR77_009316 [Saxophila tyrrhenica]
MLPSMQPSRPKAQQPRQHQSPLYQQQTRQQSSQPSSQIEAMPPHKTPAPPAPVAMSASMPAPMYNPATMHPVFFAPWRKAPFPMPGSSGFSPVATGYVFGDGRKRSQSMTKL